jgi:hypothetical protein
VRLTLAWLLVGETMDAASRSGGTLSHDNLVALLSGNALLQPRDRILNVGLIGHVAGSDQ